MNPYEKLIKNVKYFIFNIQPLSLNNKQNINLITILRASGMEQALQDFCSKRF